MLTTMQNRIIAISYKNLSRMTSAFYLLLSAPREWSLTVWDINSPINKLYFLSYQ